MDLERLSKHQIILLTLLVSFVTSIATGIVTVTLVNQAPPAVSRTINQIVEHTVQTVSPSPQGAPTVTTQKTIVVKDDDLIAQSIAALQKSIIRITAKGGDDLVARGVIIDTKGKALADRASLTASGAEAFEAILPDGRRVAVTLDNAKATSSPVATLTLSVGTSTAFTPAILGDIGKVRLGQSVIRIGGKGVDTVSQGVVAMLPNSASGPYIEANIPASTPGSILATTFGEVIGLTTTDSTAQSADTYSLLATQSAVQSTQTETKTPVKP